MTPMYEGMVDAAGGGGLLPVLVVHDPPQAGGAGVVMLAKPLNDPVFGSLVTLFIFHHCEPHQLTCVDAVADATVRSPSTKLPCARKANTMACSALVADW